MEKEIKPLLPYNPNIDEKTAMQEAMKIWAWLKDTGLSKGDHSKYDSIMRLYVSSCPLCKVFMLCDYCPLNSCFDVGSLFYNWAIIGRTGDDASKQTATAIYDKIAQAYKDRFGVEFNPYVEPESVSE